MLYFGNFYFDDANQFTENSFQILVLNEKNVRNKKLKKYFVKEIFQKINFQCGHPFNFINIHTKKIYK